MILSVCVDEEGQLDDMAWLRRRKKRAVSLGGVLPCTMSSYTHNRPLVSDTQCVAFPKDY